MADKPTTSASASEGTKDDDPASKTKPGLTESRELDGEGRDYLTNIPVELKELVFQDLNLFDKLNLKYTNKFFMTYIPDFVHGDYLEAETLPPAKGHFYACNACYRLRPRVKFADNARVKEKGPGAEKARGRYCLDCGLKEDQDGFARLPRNSWVTINKEAWIVCSQCGVLGKAHRGHGTHFCEDCWRLDVQPRLEAHANPPLPDPTTVQEQRRIGDTWVSNYTTPRDVVQSAILAGISAPDSFAKHKKWDMNGEEVAINGDYHAEEKDLVFEQKPNWVHPKLINGKNSKQQYKRLYHQPIMTRSAPHSAPATTDSSNLESSSSTAVANSASSVVTIDPAKDDYGIAGPGPSTLEKAAKKTDLESDLDSVVGIDASAPASFSTQGGHAAANSTTAISATEADPSERSNAKNLANVPIWAQKASQKAYAPLWVANQDKALQHVPAWARKGAIKEDSPNQHNPKAPETIPPNAPETTDLDGSPADSTYSKDIRVFAQSRYNVHVDMDMKPPCALKVNLEPRSYSTKPAPAACSARGNSGNIIGMNYIKARRALHQRDPNRRLGWHTVWTVKSTTPAGQDNPYVDKRRKRCCIEEDSEDEWSGFSDCSKTSTPESVSSCTSEDFCAKALASINNFKKHKASGEPEAAGSKSAFAHFNNPLILNLQQKHHLDEDSDDSFEGFSDSDTSWEGIED